MKAEYYYLYFTFFSINIIFTFIKNTIFRVVLGLQQNGEKGAEISYMLPISIYA